MTKYVILAWDDMSHAHFKAKILKKIKELNEDKKYQEAYLLYKTYILENQEHIDK